MHKDFLPIVLVSFQGDAAQIIWHTVKEDSKSLEGGSKL